MTYVMLCYVMLCTCARPDPTIGRGRRRLRVREQSGLLNRLFLQRYGGYSILVIWLFMGLLRSDPAVSALQEKYSRHPSGTEKRSTAGAEAEDDVFLF